MDEKLDELPEEFSSYEEAAEFWDTHDTADYWDEFQTVEVKSELRNRYFEIEIEEDVARSLQDRAKQQGVSLERLASELLRQKLREAA